MFTYEEFGEILEEEIGLLPEYVHEDLTGGVLLDAKEYIHPASLNNDLYILGTYSIGITGKQIVIYYGSFAATMSHYSDDAVRRQIRATLRHEFLHHLETRAGLFGKGTLVEEDREKMRKYYMRHKEPPERS